MVAERPSLANHKLTYVTPATAARLLGVSRSTIYRWIEVGRLTPLALTIKTCIPRDQIENIRLGIQ